MGTAPAGSAASSGALVASGTASDTSSEVTAGASPDDSAKRAKLEAGELVADAPGGAPPSGLNLPDAYTDGQRVWLRQDLIMSTTQVMQARGPARTHRPHAPRAPPPPPRPPSYPPRDALVSLSLTGRGPRAWQAPSGAATPQMQMQPPQPLPLPQPPQQQPPQQQMLALTAPAPAAAHAPVPGANSPSEAAM